MTISDFDVHHTTTADGVQIPYRTRGTGPPLVFVRGLNSHVVHMLAAPRNRRFFEALSAVFAVTVFDMRGNGLSEGDFDVDLDTGVEDTRAVVEALGADRVTLFGQGWGSPFAIAFAAREANRVERLILYAAYARGELLRIDGTLVKTMRDFPEAALAYMARASYPDSEAVPSQLMGTLYGTPEMGARYMELAGRVDVTAEVGRVRAPTLVVQPQRGSIPAAAGEVVAEGVPDGRYVPIPSGAYNPWSERAVASTLEAIAAFAGLDIPTNVPHRLAVLATDMVASTAIAHEVGDQRAMHLLRIHDEAVRSALGRHGGREVKHRGDGILAVFEELDSALAASEDALDGLHATRGDAPVDMRIGISHGEVFEEIGDIHGTTVVLACRLAEVGVPGGILVPADLDVGGAWASGGAQHLELKGFPEPVAVRELRPG